MIHRVLRPVAVERAMNLLVRLMPGMAVALCLSSAIVAAADPVRFACVGDSITQGARVDCVACRPCRHGGQKALAVYSRLDPGPHRLDLAGDAGDALAIARIGPAFATTPDPVLLDNHLDQFDLAHRAVGDGERFLQRKADLADIQPAHQSASTSLSAP